MAVPSSGAISLASIWNEFDNDNYSGNQHGSGEDISLKELSRGEVDTVNTGNASSDRPDGSTPHAMSEFYSYDHDISNYDASTYARLDGVDDYFYINNVPAAMYDDYSDPWSMTIWIKPLWPGTASAYQPEYMNISSDSWSTVRHLQRLFYMATTGGGSNRNRHVGQKYTAWGNDATLYRAVTTGGTGHDNNSTVGTGTSSGTAGQQDTNNRGNVNSNGFAFHAITWGTDHNNYSGGRYYYNATNLYQSGVNYQTGETSGTQVTNDTRDLTIGQRRYDNAQLPTISWALMGVKDACYWDKQLSASEVSTLYNSGTMHDVSQVSFSSNLMGFWPLTSATTTSDLSGNGRTLSVAGSPTYPNIGDNVA